MMPRRTTFPFVTLPTKGTQHVYFVLCMIQYLLNIINPSNTFRNKINVLLEEYPNIDIVAMGSPENWKEQPLWKSWTIKELFSHVFLAKNRALSISSLHLSMIRRWWAQGIRKSNLKSSANCGRFLDCSATCGTFDALLVQTIDATLGLRCTMFGYQYSKILRSLMCVYLCSGKERIYDDMNENFH